MPLVMLCGLPCAGKTSVATMLATYLKKAGQDVVLVDDSVAHLSRNEGYRGGHVPECRVLGKAVHYAECAGPICRWAC